ncbi:LacI family DNA-binding transcriptional regulator [Mycolicibacterium sp. P9-22]|uniref:LacI family DNA-binding transcriptional regulator n=1 Tax=Mycolicibacterium sp. P9-22 TaxID=2024613 RepID=UPI001D133A51|nr:LacI family DNA-binding transcriptional regulator [Mycolicibacterium sp. P9-22]
METGDIPRSPAARRATLADVAARAGVSRALVSIVIREAPGASTATRERVLRAAAELGYRPDVRARLLARSRSKLIGAVFGLAGTFHFDVLDGLYNAAEERGYELILSALTQSRGESRAVQSLQDFRLDALIMIGPDIENPALAGKVPLVTVGWRVEDSAVDCVRTSDVEGMRLAVDHLVERGHRRITHVDGGTGAVSASRGEAFLQAMRAHGLAADARVLTGGLTRFEGYTAARTMLDDPQLPTAVIGFNDEVAHSVLEAFMHAGHRVPQDISVVGWDNSLVSKLPHVRLTTISQDPSLIAKLAVDRAISRVEGGTIGERDIVLTPTLMVRATTGSARLD